MLISSVTFAKKVSNQPLTIFKDMFKPNTYFSRTSPTGIESPI